MSNYRFRTPQSTIDLGDFDDAQQALEAAVARHRDSPDPDARPAGGALEVLVGEEWHPVDIEGDMA